MSLIQHKVTKEKEDLSFSFSRKKQDSPMLLFFLIFRMIQHICNRLRTHVHSFCDTSVYLCPCHECGCVSKLLDNLIICYMYAVVSFYCTFSAISSPGSCHFQKIFIPLQVPNKNYNTGKVSRVLLILPSKRDFIFPSQLLS